MWWISSSGRIELNIPKEYVNIGYHQGQCDADIAYLRNTEKLYLQLKAIDPATLMDELREYGAWDDQELADHESNLDRILWLACGDLHDDPEYYSSED